MKKDIIVNGRKVAEVGNPMDFVVFHSNRPKDREQVKSKRDKELEQSAKEIHEKYGKYGKIPDSIFDNFLGIADY